MIFWSSKDKPHAYAQTKNGFIDQNGFIVFAHMSLQICMGSLSINKSRNMYRNKTISINS